MKRDRSRNIYERATGWLEIEITGEHAERLLNLALQQGIELTYVQSESANRIRARILLPDIYALRPLARASHCKFMIKRRAGLPFFLFKLRRRAVFISGGLLMALALYLICSIVWQVRVESPYPLTAQQRQQVTALAAEAGLIPGTPVWRLDTARIGRQIKLAEPRLIYAQVERTGITATVEVVWRQDVPEAELVQPPGEMIATADGLIENILVRSGTPAVAVGDTVKAGDILVYGYGGGKTVAASAIIEAKVWGTAEAVWPLREEGRRPSGAKSQGLLLRFGLEDTAASVWLSPESGPPYALYAQSEEAFRPVLWRNLALPVELVLHTWYEERAYVTSYTREQAAFHARQRALTLAAARLPDVCRIEEQTVRELGQDAEQVVLQATLMARADIGAFQPLDETRLRQYEQWLAQMARVKDAPNQP